MSDSFDKCLFNATYETKFLIHGVAVFLTPGNLFDDLKDALLKYGNYNVIIVDWTLYNNIPFRLAYRDARLVGEKVGEMMKFIEAYKKVSLKTFHCIGHSLGSHICGVAGRKVRALVRITGLDPGGVSLKESLKPNIGLRYTDADFVDIIHTSGISSVWTNLDRILCLHFIAIEYFTNSLKPNCKFVATECENYSDFEKGQCQSRSKTEMGFRAKKIEGIKPLTKFYLETLEFPPYCMGNESIFFARHSFGFLKV
ncbi:Phospholipase A1 member A like protein [Argiope bruennichi]|uniref:Phospholipase A1 member A like protein n=1 Tax=Argiope bruennichi TaxID=94029 RepID=A0A8T0EF27_ARGBR|nr:Phospholipase A1 member A like protein [Argiope bruennichi]